MSINIQSKSLSFHRKVLLGLTLMLAGRAMTLWFLGDVGSALEGAPPNAWLSPLVGDAVIGVSALVIAGLIVRGRGLLAWTLIVTWNAVAIWDALAAYLVHVSVPWPSFFMVQLFGSSMFFMATAMHLLCLGLIARKEVRLDFGVTA